MLKIKQRINFYDCDPAGILFYANIFRVCHSAYEELISSLGLTMDYWDNDEFVFPIINSSANYLKPLKYGDEVSIAVAVTDLRGSSFELSYNCRNQSNELCANVKTVHVFVDKKSWQKKKLIPEIKKGLNVLRVKESQ